MVFQRFRYNQYNQYAKSYKYQPANFIRRKNESLLKQSCKWEKVSCLENQQKLSLADSVRKEQQWLQKLENILDKQSGVIRYYWLHLDSSWPALIISFFHLNCMQDLRGKVCCSFKDSWKTNRGMRRIVLSRTCIDDLNFFLLQGMMWETRP